MTAIIINAHDRFTKAAAKARSAKLKAEREASNRFKITRWPTDPEDAA